MALSLAGLWGLPYLPEVCVYIYKRWQWQVKANDLLSVVWKRKLWQFYQCVVSALQGRFEIEIYPLWQNIGDLVNFYLICPFALLLCHLVSHIDNVSFRNEAWVSIRQPDRQSISMMCAFSLKR